jgi:hypothetical protein
MDINRSSKSLNQKERLINNQKREKLKGLLVSKFMKKYGIRNPEKMLQDEISKFLEGEKLSDSDLKKLDEKLKKMLSEKEASDTLRKNLTIDNFDNMGYSHSLGDVVLPDLNKAEIMSVHSKNSNMSGASHLSKFNLKDGHVQKIYDDFENLSINSYRKPVQRIDFSNEGDEWNAICVYNKKLYDEEKKLNKLKDLEIKRRTKEELDTQVRHKLRRLNEEQDRNLQNDYILHAHNEYLNEVEMQKEMERKTKILKEKENRDKQMKDEKLRKKKELLKEKKYEKELGK